MEAACSSETSVSVYKTVRCHNPKDHNQTYFVIKVHLLYEPRYVILCAGNLTDEISRVCLNFPSKNEYQKYDDNIIYEVPNDGITVTSLTDDDAPLFPHWMEYSN
jgi:hypothetical protein